MTTELIVAITAIGTTLVTGVLALLREVIVNKRKYKDNIKEHNLQMKRECLKYFIKYRETVMLAITLSASNTNAELRNSIIYDMYNMMREMPDVFSKINIYTSNELAKFISAFSLKHSNLVLEITKDDNDFVIKSTKELEEYLKEYDELIIRIKKELEIE